MEETFCETNFNEIKKDEDSFDMCENIKGQPHWKELIQHNLFNIGTYDNLFSPELYIKTIVYWLAFGVTNKQNPRFILKTMIKLSKDYLKMCKIVYFGEIVNDNNKIFEKFCDSIVKFIFDDKSFEANHPLIIKICLYLGEKDKVKKIFNDLLTPYKGIWVRKNEYLKSSDHYIREKRKKELRYLYLEQYNLVY